MDIEVAASASAPSSPLPTSRRPSGSPVGAISYGPSRVASRKRRRSTLLESVSSSSSDDDADARPAAIRLRLNNLVSEPVFQPRSQSPLVRSHTPPKQSTAQPSEPQVASDAEMDLDLEVDNCFRAMQVDSPTPSPSLSTAEWKSQDVALPLSRSPSLTRLSPPVRSTTADSPPALRSSSRPPSDTASVFPSSALVASRRTSRTLGSSTQYLPSAPSPLAHTTSFPDNDRISTRTLSAATTFHDTLHPDSSHVYSQRSTSSPPPSLHDFADTSPVTTPSRRNSEGAVTPKVASVLTLARRRSQQHPSPAAFPPPQSPSSNMLSGGKQMLRFTMGFREDCSMCRDKVPGHFSHVLGR